MVGLFWTKRIFLTSFWTKIFFGIKFFSGQNFYRPKICFGSQIFSYPKFSQTQIFFEINEELTMVPYTKNNRNFQLNTNKKLEFDTEDQVLFINFGYHCQKEDSNLKAIYLFQKHPKLFCLFLARQVIHGHQCYIFEKIGPLSQLSPCLNALFPPKPTPTPNPETDFRISGKIYF